MDKVPFCDNPLCRFHSVQVEPDCDIIERPLPGDLVERHERNLYHVQGKQFRVLCEVCSSAVELCKQKDKEKKVIAERKLVLLS